MKFTNFTLLLVSIILAVAAWPFNQTWFYKNENIFLTMRLIAFVLFMFVTIKVINSKTKKKVSTKK